MQAILITAYKNKRQIQNLINFFKVNNYVFVHLDKKSDLQIEDFQLDDHVKIIKKYTICWGGLNHLRAILDLLDMALNENISYLHIISGQDIPVKSIEEFSKFENSNKIYMQCENVQGKDVTFKNRYKKGALFSNKSSIKLCWHIINTIYGLFHHKNGIGYFSEEDIYIGLVWCSMPIEAAKYIKEYASKNFPKYWKHIIIPEEFFFQTVLYNSKFNKNIVKTNLRYCDWHYRNGSLPAYLDKSDIEKISEGNYCFARKIDPNISKEVVKELFDNDKINLKNK